MNVVGVHILCTVKHRRTAQQPLTRRAAFAVGRVNAWDTQQAQAHGVAAQSRIVALPCFRVDTSHRSRRGGIDGAAVAHPRSCAITKYPAGRAIHPAARRCAHTERAGQREGARVGAAAQGRWRQVQHTGGQAGQTLQSNGLV